MCNSILRFSESKRRAKDFRRSIAAAKARLRGGFRPPKPNTPPKFQKLSFYTVHIAALRNRRATGARMGLVSKRNLFVSALTLMPCHVAVCVNCVLGAKVQFLRVITQSTGLIFLPSLPIGKKLGSNSTFLYSEKLCAKLNLMDRVVFLLNYPYILITIACSRTCLHLSSQSCRSTANGTSWRHRVSRNFFSELRATIFFAAFFLKRKRVLFSAFSSRSLFCGEKGKYNCNFHDNLIKNSCV